MQDLYFGTMTTKPGSVVRCGTPDCDWGFPMPDLDKLALEACYSGFWRHCIDVHGLGEATTAKMFLNLEEWTLTLLK
jgi:hypothetical protein